MPESPPLAPLLEALRDLIAWLKATRIQGVVIGGVAASILGRPRVTRDIDVLVRMDESRWQEFLTAGNDYRFIPRISDPLEFAAKARVLLVRHGPSAIDVDIVLGSLPFEEEVVRRATSTQVGSIALPLPSPEDLLIMKAVAHRTRDLLDIESLLDAHPDLDLRRVREWVQQFSAALESPEILEDLDQIIARKRP